MKSKDFIMKTPEKKKKIEFDFDYKKKFEKSEISPLFDSNLEKPLIGTLEDPVQNLRNLLNSC